jgi:hypothetical protein
MVAQNPRCSARQKTDPGRDLSSVGPNVCYWHKADTQTAPTNVRSEGNSGHEEDVARCLLMIQIGHSAHSSALGPQFFLPGNSLF